MTIFFFKKKMVNNVIAFEDDMIKYQYYKKNIYNYNISLSMFIQKKNIWNSIF